MVCIHHYWQPRLSVVLFLVVVVQNLFFFSLWPRESRLAPGAAAARDRLRGMDEFISAMKTEISRASIILRDSLFRKWKFTEILEEIQAVYLFGAGDAMENFGALVFQWIVDHHLRKTTQASSDSSSELDLTGLLASQFQDCGHPRAGCIVQRAKIKVGQERWRHCGFQLYEFGLSWIGGSC